jgi:hypothetical protein
MLPTWLYLQKMQDFTYNPIPGLIDGVDLTKYSLITPQFNRLSGAYLAETQLLDDLTIIRILNDKDNVAEENLFPTKWIALSTAANLKKTVIIGDQK